MATETTLVLVKPDGVRRALCGEIVSRFERRGYELRGARLLKIPRALAQQHYAEHKERPFFGELVTFITSGPVLALAVRGENAILGVRGMMGATNPADSAPGTIRGDFATLLSENIVHGSDSKASAKRELKLFFPDGLALEASPGVRAPGRPPLVPMTDISDDAKRNREDWTQANADYTDAQASSSWAAEEITWGVFGIPEAPLDTLGDVDGLDVVELGCGTAYVSAWLAKRGARPSGST